jgi:hypothetical protein
VLVTMTGLLVYFAADRQPAAPLADNQWYLPDYLNEASGLAVIDEDTVLAHSDEAGVIYRIALAAREVVELGAIGSPPIDEDLEGIALAGTDIYLVNRGTGLWRWGLAVALQNVARWTVPGSACCVPFRY